METLFMNTENSKTNKSHKFDFKSLQRLDLRCSNKHIALQNLTIFQTQKNIRKRYKNKILKTIATTWNNEFELPDGSYSVSDI